MGHLWDALPDAFEVLGFAGAAGGDEVFRQLVLARIIEPTSKLDSLRVLDEAGIGPPAYATLKRHLPVFATDSWRQQLAAACAALSYAALSPGSTPCSRSRACRRTTSARSRSASLVTETMSRRARTRLARRALHGRAPQLLPLGQPPRKQLLFLIAQGGGFCEVLSVDRDLFLLA